MVKSPALLKKDKRWPSWLFGMLTSLSWKLVITEPKSTSMYQYILLICVNVRINERAPESPTIGRTV